LTLTAALASGGVSGSVTGLAIGAQPATPSPPGGLSARKKKLIIGLTVGLGAPFLLCLLGAALLAHRRSRAPPIEKKSSKLIDGWQMVDRSESPADKMLSEDETASSAQPLSSHYVSEAARRM
jgi:hypothetical protein